MRTTTCSVLLRFDAYKIGEKQHMHSAMMMMHRWDKQRHLAAPVVGGIMGGSESELKGSLVFSLWHEVSAPTTWRP